MRKLTWAEVLGVMFHEQADSWVGPGRFLAFLPFSVRVTLGRHLLP